MWLCILFKLRRSSSAKLWPSFQFFVAIVIILEYVLFVGLPPGLCMGELQILCCIISFEDDFSFRQSGLGIIHLI